MASARFCMDVARREVKAVRGILQTPKLLYVVPYNAPWYELLLSGKLTIKTVLGKFGVKTGSMPKRHRGWVGFYNSKARVRMEVVERHGIDPNDLNLGMLVGMGYLEDSRELTLEEQYQWYLRANKTDDATVVDYLTYDCKINPSSIKERVDWFNRMLHNFVGHPLVIAGPMPVGNFYRPDSLMRFTEPISITYPSGPVSGTKLPITPEIRRAMQKLGIKL